MIMGLVTFVTVAAILVLPMGVLGQAKPPDSCNVAAVTDPPIWVGVAPRPVTLRVGPGPEFDPHESGELDAGEEVQVLSECRDWLQGRVIPHQFIQGVIAANGLERASQMLLFWIHRNALRPIDTHIPPKLLVAVGEETDT